MVIAEEIAYKVAYFAQLYRKFFYVKVAVDQLVGLVVHNKQVIIQSMAVLKTSRRQVGLHVAVSKRQFAQVHFFFKIPV